MDTTLFEYPTSGVGDFRSPAIEIQTINGDTIYVDAVAEIALKLPSKLTDFYTLPRDAPYNLISLGNGFTISAKKKNTKITPLFVTEDKRTHQFFLVYKKDINYNDPKETNYDYSTLKKLKEHVKGQEEIEKKYNDLIKAADILFNSADYINAKALYTQALGLRNRSWPKEQIKKANKYIPKRSRWR